MPITGFKWIHSHGCDIHVLRNGQPSRPLEDFIIVIEEMPGQTDPDGNLKLEFKTLRDIRSGAVSRPQGFGSVIFQPFWSERGTLTPPVIEINGISVNRTTGVIQAQNSPAPLITSFFIAAVLLDPAGNNVNLPENPPAPLITVHVHNQMTNAWVTPASLTTRPDIVKGISNFELKMVSTKTIERIVWGSDDSFQHSIGEFLLNGQDPFEGATNFQPGTTFSFFAPPLFDNGRLFPVAEVFRDPMHLEIRYAGQPNPVRMTIPTHQVHLLSNGQILDDGAGNNVFEVVRVEKKAQYKASVYATFDDGTIGDLTNDHGVTWERGPGVDLSDITFDPDGAFEVATSAVGKTLPIRARLPASLSRPGLTEATGNVIVRESWLNANPIAERIPGSPTHLPAETIPNVIFIAEGFQSPQEFRTVALSVYNRLRTNPRTTPWNHLFTSRMNAWMLYEESRETAASILYESVVFEDLPLEDSTPADVALPLGDVVDLVTGKLSDQAGIDLRGLVIRVGWPSPADAQATRAQKETEWRQLVDQNFGTGALGFSDPEFNFWIRLSTRRLVEERDTAWGLRCGEKPKAAPDIPAEIISMNVEARLQRSNLDLFFSRVRADSATGDLIGERFWGRDRQGKFGKDYGLVVFLVGGLRTIGTRFGESYFPQGIVNTGIGVGLVDALVPLNSLGPELNVNSAFFVPRPVQGAPSFEMVPFPVPREIPLGAFGRVAHELAHSFNLDDEYARITRLSLPDNVRLNTTLNLQRRNDVLDGGQLSGELVKWRWPRIRKAGVVQADPAVGPTISVTLRVGEVGQFDLNETVRFRQRSLETPRADLSSPDLKVLSKNETTQTLTLEPLVPTPNTTWARFGPDSLLYAPVKAPSASRDNPTNDVYAEVLSPLIRHQINQPPHNPQTLEPCQEDTKDQQDPVNLPDLSRPQERRRVIGLYSGGKGFSCNVFHPSGECIMRKETQQRVNRVTGVVIDRQVYQFCHVCRYGLVDQIDPRQHDQIDREYEQNYPLADKPVSVLKVLGLIALGILLLVGVGYLIKESTESEETS